MYLLMSKRNCASPLNTNSLNLVSVIHIYYIYCLPVLITLTVGNYNVTKFPHHLLCTPVHQPQSTVIIRLVEAMLICKPVHTPSYNKSYVASTLEHSDTCMQPRSQALPSLLLFFGGARGDPGNKANMHVYMDSYSKPA